MAKKTSNKKELSKELILESYTDYVLSKGEKPKSVYIFAKENQMEESEFYHFFSSFEALENEFFEMLFTHTLSVLQKSKEYKEYESKEKLLSFYFTFFENLKINRSFVLFVLQKERNTLENIRKLSKLRNCILEYVGSLGLNTLPIEQKNITEIQQKAQKEAVWLQFMGILKFWLNDTSQDFEKTDIFIEKSIDVGFDFLENTHLNKWIDFGKFLFKEGKRIL